MSITKTQKYKTFGKILLPFVNPAFLLMSGKIVTGDKNPCEAAVAGKEAPTDKPKKKKKKRRKRSKKST